MAQSQQVIREIIVADAVASETTLPTFLATASPGEVAVVAADGGAPAFGKDFFVVKKGPSGQLIKSDLVKADQVTRYEGVPFEDEVARSIEVGFTVPSTAGAKVDYQVQIRVYNAGSLSVQNTELIVGHYRFTQTGALTAEAVVDGLIANLNANLSKKPGATSTTNPYFSITKSGTGAGAELVISSISQPLVLGKKFGRPLEFDVIAFVNPDDESDVASTATVDVAEPGNPGKGTGKQVAVLEWFYRGERGDNYRGLKYPYTWSTETKTTADPNAEYNMVEINHWNGNKNGINAIIVPKELTIAIAEDGVTTDMEALVAAIEGFLVEPEPTP